MKNVFSPDAPQPIGPYSQAIIVGNFVFVSGQIGLDAKTGELVSSKIEEQTEFAIRHIEAILKSVNLELKNVVKTTIFLKNMSDFTKVNSVYERFFGDTKPARSCVGVLELPKNALVEIEAIAYKF